MAAEALKYILNAGTSLRGQMAIYNVLDAQNRMIKTETAGRLPDLWLKFFRWTVLI
jgi:hypothetical protein